VQDDLGLELGGKLPSMLHPVRLLRGYSQSAFTLCTCPVFGAHYTHLRGSRARAEPAFLVAGLLERGLEVRLLGLQSILVYAALSWVPAPSGAASSSRPCRFPRCKPPHTPRISPRGAPTSP